MRVQIVEAGHRARIAIAAQRAQGRHFAQQQQRFASVAHRCGTGAQHHQPFFLHGLCFDGAGPARSSSSASRSKSSLALSSAL
jgi:hypothetical protein